MPITDIVEVPNPTATSFRQIKEVQDIYVPDITNLNISRRNGMIYALTGSGGSGKTNLLLNMFKSKKCYRNKFHHIYYFCPAASFSSLEKHPFENHEQVFHELSIQNLENIYNELIFFKKGKKDEKKEKTEGKYDGDIDEAEESEEEEEVQYSCVIIDDYADQLKDKAIQQQLNKMLIKARHLCCGFIFTLQSYFYLPKILRKQLTYISIFRSKNIEEWYSIANELMNLKKDDALKLYDYVFDKPYTHLDIDNTNFTIYKNFNLLKFKT